MNLYKLIGILMLLVAALSGCASNPQGNSGETSPIIVEENTADPYEGFNRAMFSFNMKLDRWALRPAAVGYTKITPDPVEKGVGNFFSNLSEIRNVVNDVLQWKWKQAGNDTGRFLINSTVGIAGIFDVAKKAGLPESEGEDFGQTLGAWGVPKGPYLVVPLLGPNTITSTAGLPADWVLNPASYHKSKTVRYSLTAANIIHMRSRLLDLEELASGDLYVFYRDAYLQRRDYLVNDGKVDDDFGGGFEEDSDEGFDF
ncbi:MlaA family lipoprotein [Teredinibacter haidensis]|uniref:MlaA family lipoprotein n=1 Tax=Teredinibacter haidensis TaxID=2731755 RepID=UPI000948AA85|nr:VacJ family lipoprotein [Teredinibacter haidensis]